MRTFSVLILACSIMLAFEARSQNQGVKSLSNPAVPDISANQVQSTQDITMLQGLNTSGGSTTPSSLSEGATDMYLEPGWVNGKVYLTDDKELNNIILRYDIYNQQIQFIDNDDTLAFANPEEVDYFLLGDRKLIYSDYDKNGIVKNGIFEVLSEGPCKLLVRHAVKYHINGEVAEGCNENQYIRDCEFYLLKDNSPAMPIKATRKSILSALNDKEDEVRSFIRENHLKVNTCGELKQVLSFYNSLL